MKKIIFLSIIAIIIAHTGYTYYRTNLLPFQSLLLECKSEYIKYPYEYWTKNNTTTDEWDHYQSAKENYPIIKFPLEFKIKFNYKNTGKFIEAEDFFKDKSFYYETNVSSRYRLGKNHTHFNIDFPIPGNKWFETFSMSVPVKHPYISSKDAKKLSDGKKDERTPFPRTFLIQYLSGFFNDVDAFYFCEEIK